MLPTPGWRALKTLKRLERLRLGGTRISNAGLVHLEGLKESHAGLSPEPTWIGRASNGSGGCCRSWVGWTTREP